MQSYKSSSGEKNIWAYYQQIISLDCNVKQCIEIWGLLPKHRGSIYRQMGLAAVVCWNHFSTYFANCSDIKPKNATLSVKITDTSWVRFVVEKFALIMELNRNLMQWIFIEEESYIYMHIWICLYMEGGGGWLVKAGGEGLVGMGRGGWLGVKHV